MKKYLIVASILFGFKAMSQQTETTDTTLSPSMTLNKAIQQDANVMYDPRLVDAHHVDFIIVNGVLLHDEFEFVSDTGAVFMPMKAGDKVFISFKK